MRTGEAGDALAYMVFIVLVIIGAMVVILGAIKLMSLVL